MLTVKLIKPKNDQISAKIKARLDKLPVEIPRPPFRWIMAACSNRGKTNLIVNLFEKEFYGNFFKPENIIVFSPTADLDPKLRMIPSKNFFEVYDDALISDLMSQQEATLKLHGKKRLPHVLAIFDDCLSEKCLKAGSMLTKLIFRARHYNISVIITAQKLSACNRTIRLNVDSISIWEPNNGSELDFILNEFASKATRKRFAIEMDRVFAEPYAFIHIDLMSKDRNQRYRHNFGEAIDMFS